MSTNTTPATRSPRNSSSASKSGSRLAKNGTSSGSRFNKASPLFTPAMQDRQARNKDPYGSSDDDSSEGWEGPGSRFDAYGNDSYENIQKRREAAEILDNPELIMMTSLARCDSIPGTRTHFTKILCGLIDAKDAERSLEPPAEKEIEKEKNKTRASKASSSRGSSGRI